MKETTKRSIVRWIHIVCAIPIVGYIYSPFENIPDYAPMTHAPASGYLSMATPIAIGAMRQARLK
jgi:hypothetical protein